MLLLQRSQRLMGQNLKCRYGNQGNPGAIAKTLGRRRSHPKPRIGPGAATHGNRAAIPHGHRVFPEHFIDKNRSERSVGMRSVADAKREHLSVLCKSYRTELGGSFNQEHHHIESPSTIPLTAPPTEAKMFLRKGKMKFVSALIHLYMKDLSKNSVERWK